MAQLSRIEIHESTICVSIIGIVPKDQAGNAHQKWKKVGEGLKRNTLLCENSLYPPWFYWKTCLKDLSLPRKHQEHHHFEMIMENCNMKTTSSRKKKETERIKKLHICLPALSLTGASYQTLNYAFYNFISHAYTKSIALLWWFCSSIEAQHGIAEPFQIHSIKCLIQNPL